VFRLKIVLQLTMIFKLLIQSVNLAFKEGFKSKLNILHRTLITPPPLHAIHPHTSESHSHDSQTPATSQTHQKVTRWQ